MNHQHQKFAVRRPVFARTVLGTAIALAIGTATPALAFEFSSESGEVTGSFDTTVSAGALWRMEGRSASLTGITNGGTARSVNEDDGNRNYKEGEPVSAVLKATHDLEINYRNFGAFVRASYFYDDAAANKSELGSKAKDRLRSDAEILDAYVRASFDLGGRNLNLRLGKQVVSWGESTFILNGINVLNPVNVSRLRIPGSELKEGLVPTNMLWASQEITDNVSAEVVWMLDWKKTQIDPRGSYFSSNDFLSDDGRNVFIGFGRRKDLSTPATNPVPPLTPVVGGIAAALAGPFDPAAAVWAPRAADRDARDDGQYGLALRAFFPELNNSEVGVYHAKYHSRTPIASGIRGTPTSALTGTAIAAPIGQSGTARYFAEYPEDIELYGVSINTSGPWGVALQGEYSYRPNQPLQLASPELLLAALGSRNAITGTRVLRAGTVISGYERVKMQQLQVTGTKAFGPTFGAEQLVVVGEVGYTRLNLPSGAKFNSPGVFLPAPGSDTSTSFGATQTKGFMTKDSWGYRVVGRMDFPNAIGAATVSPRIAFSHDVDGTGPTFNEDAKALTFGVGFNYRQNWQADISYTAFFGGRSFKGTDTRGAYESSSNPLKDRDFLSLNVSYSF